MRKKAIIIATVAVLAVGAPVAAVTAVVASTPANAASAPEHIGYIKTAATSYVGPSNQTTPVHVGLQAGQQVNIICFTEGQSLNGNSYWFRIGQAGNLGFVHRDAIAPGVGMPHC
jgi:hypothetical protein